jgi:hypothetical protein
MFERELELNLFSIRPLAVAGKLTDQWVKKMIATFLEILKNQSMN